MYSLVGKRKQIIGSHLSAMSHSLQYSCIVGSFLQKPKFFTYSYSFHLNCVVLNKNKSGKMQIKKKKLLVYFCIILENLMINVLFLTLESELGSKQKKNNKVHPNDNKNS